MSLVRVAGVQMLAGGGKGENLAKALGLIDRAVAIHGQLDLICLPEFFYAIPGHHSAASLAEGIPGPLTEAMAAKARQHQTYLVAGSFPERAPGSRVYNTCLLFDRQGEIVGAYRKTHLMDALTARESEVVAPGATVGVFQTDFGRVGLMVCYDLRFPELPRTMALAGAEMIVSPSAFPYGQALPPRTDHWDVLTRCTALLNLSHVVAVNQYGTHGRENFFGRSSIIDPWGTVIAQAAPGEKVIFAVLDLDYQRGLRQQLPVLQQRRPDLYRLQES